MIARIHRRSQILHDNPRRNVPYDASASRYSAASSHPRRRAGTRLTVPARVRQDLVRPARLTPRWPHGPPQATGAWADPCAIHRMYASTMVKIG
jgi:hypothetical protein